VGAPGASFDAALGVIDSAAPGESPAAGGAGDLQARLQQRIATLSAMIESSKTQEALLLHKQAELKEQQHMLGLAPPEALPAPPAAPGPVAGPLAAANAPPTVGSSAAAPASGRTTPVNPDFVAAAAAAAAAVAAVASQAAAADAALSLGSPRTGAKKPGGDGNDDESDEHSDDSAGHDSEDDMVEREETVLEWATERVRIRQLYKIVSQLMRGYDAACRDRIIQTTPDGFAMYPSLFMLTEQAFMYATTALSQVLLDLTLTMRALHLARNVWH
jgi:hypothetical protein